jgi:cytochrome c oxidase assembly protein subunit 15
VAVALFAQRVLARDAGVETERRARWAAILAFGQIALGVVNFGLLAPIPLQLAHLFLADLVWVATVMAGAAALAAQRDGSRANESNGLAASPRVP